jgi:hypothetical protein
MKTHNEPLGGWLAPTPETPQTFDEIVQWAMTEHLKFHLNDGLELFIWATLAVAGDQIYIYPISAKDVGAALEIAMRLHEMRDVLPSGDWKLLFPQSEYHLVVMND